MHPDFPQPAPTPTTIDGFAGGRIEVVQPADGRHRSGLEAALLAASIEQDFNGTVVDLGAGAGAVGLTIASRCPKAAAVLVDRDRSALACASAALARPLNAGFADRVRIVEADISSPEADRVAAGLSRASADAVVANPPFRQMRKNCASPNVDRSAAHLLDASGLEPWVRCSASVLKAGGQFVVIVAADLVVSVFNCLGHRFGGVDVLPIHPRPDAAASRVLLRAIKNSRAGMRLLPALVLHDLRGRAYLPHVEAVLRGRAGLCEVHAAWASRG